MMIFPFFISHYFLNINFSVFFDPVEQFELFFLTYFFDIDTEIYVLFFNFLFLFFLFSNLGKLNIFGYLMDKLLSFYKTLFFSFFTKKKHQVYFFPFFFIFIFILSSNIIGLLPYTYTLTSLFILTFFLAFVTVGSIIIIYFEQKRWEIFNHFFPTGVPAFIGILLIVLEVISYFVRLFSLITYRFLGFVNYVVLPLKIIFKKYFTFRFFLSSFVVKVQQKYNRSLITYRFLDFVKYSILSPVILIVGICCWSIRIGFLEKHIVVRRILKLVIKVIFKFLIAAIVAQIFIFSAQLFIYLLFSNAIVYAAGEHVYNFEDFSALSERVCESWLYNGCETADQKALALNYLTKPHFRCVIIWYVACHYAHYRPDTCLSYFFPERFPWPQPTESEYFDICLDTLDLDTIAAIVNAAEAGLPGFSEYWRPRDGYYLNPVEQEPWMRQGPIIPWMMLFGWFMSIVWALLTTRY